MKQFGKVVILALVITGCQTIPEKPANVSLEFDGIWKGERIITSGSRCLETKIEGSVNNGLAELTLIYNGTLLTIGPLSDFSKTDAKYSKSFLFISLLFS